MSLWRMGYASGLHNISSNHHQEETIFPSSSSNSVYDQVWSSIVRRATAKTSTLMDQADNGPNLMLGEEISNIMSICVIVFSFLCSLFVLINLCKKNIKADREERYHIEHYENSHPSIVESLTSKKHLYTKLTSFCILCMIISDLLFTAFYFPTNALRLIKGFLLVDLPPKDRGNIDPYFTIPVYICAEITELFVISSGFFSMLLTLCIYKTIKSIKPHGSTDEQSNYSQSIRSSSPGDYPKSYGTVRSNSYNEQRSTEKTRLVDSKSPTSDSSVNSSSYYDEMDNPSYHDGEDNNIQQPSHMEKYRKIQATKKKLQILFSVISWGIPAAFAIVWIVVEELYMAADSLPSQKFFANIIPDMVKNLIYITIEVVSVALRVMIYLVTKKLFSDTIIVQNTPSAKKKREKEKNLFKQLLFYALPFFLFGIWVIVYRLATDIIYIVRVAKDGLNSFSDDPDLAGVIVLSIHHILSPMRAFANSLVYCLLSKWFSDRVKGTLKKCCGGNGN